MTEFITDDIKVVAMKPSSLKVKAVTKYVKSKTESMTVMAFGIGKNTVILFQDMGGILEYWAPNDIMNLYSSGQASMASFIGMDFLTRNNLITAKAVKELEKKRHTYLTTASEQMANGFIEAIEMLKEDSSTEARQALERIRSVLLDNSDE